MNAAADFLLPPFPEWAHRVRAAFTLRYAGAGVGGQGGADGAVGAVVKGASSGAYADLNLGFRAGDAPENPARNWETVLAAAGVPGKPLVLPRMIHGDGLADGDALPDADPADEPPAGSTPLRFEPADADAVWARTPRRVLAVTMADCLTALIFDPHCGSIAAVHAGWRGTHARILEKTLRTLADAGRIRPQSTLVAFGPCLRRETLEVGEELAVRLDKDFVVRRDGRFHFDMPASNRAQALACGISPANLRDMGGDTRLEPERYFSYRRDGQASGRMAAFISLL